MHDPSGLYLSFNATVANASNNTLTLQPISAERCLSGHTVATFEQHELFKGLAKLHPTPCLN
jgi:hypothetical protein